MHSANDLVQVGHQVLIRDARVERVHLVQDVPEHKVQLNLREAPARFCFCIEHIDKGTQQVRPGWADQEHMPAVDEHHGRVAFTDVGLQGDQVDAGHTRLLGVEGGLQGIGITGGLITMEGREEVFDVQVRSFMNTYAKVGLPV